MSPIENFPRFSKQRSREAGRRAGKEMLLAVSEQRRPATRRERLLQGWVCIFRDPTETTRGKG